MLYCSQNSHESYDSNKPRSRSFQQIQAIIHPTITHNSAVDLNVVKIVRQRARIIWQLQEGVEWFYHSSGNATEGILIVLCKNTKLEGEPKKILGSHAS